MQTVSINDKKMKYIKLTKQVTLLILIFSVSSCTNQETNHTSQITKEITINEDSFGEEYPAVFLDLKNNSLMIYSKDLTVINADLWIEPNDPEISGLTKEFEGMEHVGEDVLLRIIDKNLSDKDISSLDLNTFQRKLDKSKIKAGLVFAVMASDHSLYKVKIISFTIAEQEIKLEHQKIK